MHISGIIGIGLYGLAIMCALFILFFEQKNSARRFAWLLTVLFIPGIGLILYVTFSGNFFTRTKRMADATSFANAHYAPLIQTQHRNLDEFTASGMYPALSDYGQLIHLNLVYGGSPLLLHNSLWIYTSGEEKYRSLFAELGNAKRTINLSYFIINNDHTGRALMDILARKAREGVEVRLLYDHLGSILTSPRLFSGLRRAGGQVSRFFPLSLRNPFRVNYRNHRKIVVIDGVTGYFGGVNIGDEYANADPNRKYYWRDTHVRITGAAVALLQKQFLVDWYTSVERDRTLLDVDRNRVFFPDQAAPGGTGAGGDTASRGPMPYLPEICIHNVPVQIVSSGPDDAENDEIRDALVLMISRARKSVYIETPYFTPDEAFYSALKIAALSGIDVRIIIPGDWDKWYVKLAAMPYVSELLSFGVRFWRYTGFIHAKMLVIDGVISTIGSTNVDTRSFSLHFELNAFFYSAQAAEACERVFLDDLRKSRETTTEWFARVSPARKAIWNFFRLFSPLM